MTGRTPARAPLPLLPIVACGVFAFTTIGIVFIAGPTLGYDFEAYVRAAQRVLDGKPLYDPTVQVAVGFGVYLYPPPFAIAAIPFTLLPQGTFAQLSWIATQLVVFLVGVAILPVRRDVRWLVVLLAALDWPFLYSIKLGQVGPLLFLLCAIAWRWRARPGVLGTAIAAGTLVKLQPALLFAWALFTGRRRAAAIGVLAVLVLSAGASLFTGLTTWGDYLALVVRVSDPITTPNSVSAGAIAYQAGWGQSAATVVQWSFLALVGGIVIYAWLRADEATSLVVTAVASQIVSPVVWVHYAVLLLLPVALLLDRGRRWAVLIPVAGWLPGAFYPLLFLVGLVGPLVSRTQPRPRPVMVPPAR